MVCGVRLMYTLVVVISLETRHVYSPASIGSSFLISNERFVRAALIL